MSLKQEIIDTIIAALPDASVYVADPDGEHFEALVISPSFEEMSLVKQHQSVMKPLKSHFDTSVHALALKTFTPKQWEEKKHLYDL